MNQIFTWIMLIIATERVVELIVDSKIFEPLRHLIKRLVYPIDEPPLDTSWQRIKISIDYLFNCGYCVSVWVSGFFALFVEKNFESDFINWLISMLFLHGMSNLYHVLYELVRRGRISTYDVALKVTVENNQVDSDDV